MAISREDKDDVKRELGKKVARKVELATKDKSKALRKRIFDRKDWADRNLK